MELFEIYVIELRIDGELDSSDAFTHRDVARDELAEKFYFLRKQMRLTVSRNGGDQGAMNYNDVFTGKWFDNWEQSWRDLQRSFIVALPPKDIYERFSIPDCEITAETLSEYVTDAGLDELTGYSLTMAIIERVPHIKPGEMLHVIGQPVPMKTIYIAAIDSEDDLQAVHADTEEGIIQAVLEACGEDHDAYLAWMADGGHDETAKFASDSVTDFMKSRGDEMFGWSYNAVELPAAPEGEAVLATPTAKAIQNAMGAINGLVDQIGQMSGMFDDEDGTIQQACDDAEEALAELKELASGASVELSAPSAADTGLAQSIEDGFGEMYDDDSRWGNVSGADAVEWLGNIIEDARNFLKVAPVELASPAPVELAVIVDGGLVQHCVMRGDAKVNVTVVDYDVEGADDDDVTEIPQGDGKIAEASVSIACVDKGGSYEFWQAILDGEQRGDCGQCEGTGTIEGGLGGDGEDEECPVCDGTGNLPEEEGSLYDLGDHAVSQELAPEAGYVLIDGFDGENESALMMQVLDTIPNKTLQDVMCANSHEISGVIRLGPVDDLQEIWATTHTDPSGGNAEFCLVYRKEG